MGQKRTSPQSCRGSEIQRTGTEVLHSLEKKQSNNHTADRHEEQVWDERGVPGRSCPTSWKQEMQGCNFLSMASQSCSSQTPDTRSENRGIWVGLGWILPVETLFMTTQKACNAFSGKQSNDCISFVLLRGTVVWLSLLMY